ncbi:hypothetical protein SPFM8_00028 [Salmonella phage SPFM8]|nr:hypothetical protein SPFM8_00028 [Salmonella phage SPFM8]
MLPLHYSYIGWVYAYTQNIVYYLEMPWKDSGLNSGQWKAQVSDQAPHNLKRNILFMLLSGLGWNINEAVRNMLEGNMLSPELPETGSKAYDDLVKELLNANPLGNGTTHPAVKANVPADIAGMDPALNSPVVQALIDSVDIQNNQGIENQAVSEEWALVPRCQGMLDFARNVIQPFVQLVTLNVEDHEPTLFELKRMAIQTPQAGTGEASVIADTAAGPDDTQITDEEFFQSLPDITALKADVDSPVGLLTKATTQQSVFSLNAVTNAMKLAKQHQVRLDWSHPGFHQHQKRGSGMINL